MAAKYDAILGKLRQSDENNGDITALEARVTEIEEILDRHLIVEKDDASHTWITAMSSCIDEESETLTLRKMEAVDNEDGTVSLII